MLKIAFYAPMKSPNHPTPSGDREVARGIQKALGARLVSELRVYDGKGDIDTQQNLIRQAKAETENLIKQGRTEGWKLWFTYHNYYKAPDLIGPIVSKALGIPYVLLEATRAKRRLNGPWSDFAALAEKASDQANVILYFTQNDREALEKYRHKGQQIIHLPPFLIQNKAAPPRNQPNGNTLLSVGMMRSGAKLKSYTLIAQVLGALKTPNWHLNIAGDGPVRAEVKTLLAPFGKRISFLGQLDKTNLDQHYATSSIFFWPGVEEAFGMVYIEAQAAGLPIVAQNRPGVRDIITPMAKLSAIDAPNDMAHKIDALFKDVDHWQSQSQAGIAFVEQNHLFGVAAKNLADILSPLIGSTS